MFKLNPTVLSGVYKPGSPTPLHVGTQTECAGFVEGVCWVSPKKAQSLQIEPTVEIVVADPGAPAYIPQAIFEAFRSFASNGHYGRACSLLSIVVHPSLQALDTYDDYGAAMRYGERKPLPVAIPVAPERRCLIDLDLPQLVEPEIAFAPPGVLQRMDECLRRHAFVEAVKELIDHYRTPSGSSNLGLLGAKNFVDRCWPRVDHLPA